MAEAVGSGILHLMDLYAFQSPTPEAQATASAPVVLLLGFSDPRCSLRVAQLPPPAVRLAFEAQLAAKNGTVMPGTSLLSAVHPTALLAVQAAIDLLGNSSLRLTDESAPLAMRAVLIEATDDSETALDHALTRAGEVLALSRDHTLLVSRGLYEQLDHKLSERARLAVSPAIAGSYPLLADLFDLDWRAAAPEQPEVTGAPAPRHATQSGDQLELSHGGTQICVNAADCPITLGRDKSCTLYLDGDVASRLHARIEFIHDKFYFIDESRNGSYLLTPQGEEVFLHNERLPLLGRGVISAGAPIVKQTGEVVRYLCRSQDAAGTMDLFAPTPTSAAAKPLATH
jgi:hypothetical protein